MKGVSDAVMGACVLRAQTCLVDGGAEDNETAEVDDHGGEDVFVEDVVLDVKELVDDVYFLGVAAVALWPLF